jgi:hypothetical protein
VLLTEILMPDGDGVENICAVTRARPDVRIIAVAERRLLGRLDLLDLAGNLGADATLEKPLGGSLIGGESPANRSDPR